MQAQQQQIIQKCKEVFALALEKYGVDLSRTVIRFDLRGRAAGQAYCKRGQYGMRFNHDMLGREAFSHVLNNTVPHEIAHLVCFMKPELGRGHDSGWSRVCRSLGGNGATRHKEEVILGKGRTYEYITDRGNKVRMGDKHHNYVQRGGTLRYKRGLGNVTQTCTYSIVGIQGRSIAQPVVQRAPNHPAVIEEHVRSVQVPQVQAPAQPPAALINTGESKASISRRLMLAGFNRGASYETIIQAMIQANGYDRQLARATFKANAAKCGIPATFYA